MAPTFGQLGIPFPLFEAPADQAAEYGGLDACSLCGKAEQHCFTLDIGCDLMVNCPSCGAVNGLDASDREPGECRDCGKGVPFPAVAAEEEEIRACYACLRAGRGAISKDTELGMVSWDRAIIGVTLGVPGLSRGDFEMVATEDDWVGARLPSEQMGELLRTPTYETIQGERWQFCCRQPMVFLGEWSREEFRRRAPDGDSRRYFEAVVQDSEPGLWEDRLHDVTGVYVFRCPECSRVTAHWDIA